jgi:hypothetical protein
MAGNLSRSRIGFVADAAGLHCQYLLVSQGTMVFNPKFDEHGYFPLVFSNIAFIGVFTQE